MADRRAALVQLNSAPLAATTVSSTGVPVMVIPDIAVMAMNDSHWMAGTFADRAVVRDADGRLIDLVDPAEYPRSYSGRALHIDNSGTAVGEFLRVGGGLWEGYLWQNGVLTPLPYPPLYALTGFKAKRIDEEGNILVGYQRSTGGNATAVLRPPYGAGDYVQVPSPAGAYRPHVLGLDISGGVVVGGSDAWGSAWRWTPGSPAIEPLAGGRSASAILGDVVAGRTFTNIGALLAPVHRELGTLGGSYSAPSAVNAEGWVVGESSRAGSTSAHAFLWTPAGGMIDLGTLGGESSTAVGIDVHGHIVGRAQTASGAWVSVVWLLAPDEPSNEAPVANAGGPYLAAVGESLQLDGSLSTDPDDDVLEYTWVLGNGTAEWTIAEGETPVIVAPATSALYTLSLTVTDPSGASSVAVTELAVYDPAAASVSGGGWFTVPAGSLVSDLSAEGRASFAFHAQYRRGMTTPDGSARLSFAAGGLQLRSSSFDWLVVGSDMARFRGVGALAGEADAVRFEIVAYEPDRIRVRIWSDAAGTIFDSQDVSLGAGRIVIGK